MQVWLKNLRIVLPDQVIDQGAVLVEGAQIADICTAGLPHDQLPQVDGTGLMLIPGAIDMHGDMIEQEAEPRLNAQFPLDLAMHELDRRLAAAGVTTAYAAVSFWEPSSEERKARRSGERAAQLVDAVARMRDELLIDMRVHARYEVTTPEVAPPLRRSILAGHVQMISLMDHTPGQGQYRDVERYVRYLAAYRNQSLSELTDEAEDRMRRAREDTSFWAIAHELVGLASERGMAIASHDDDTEQKVGLMADLGVTISEFPVALEAAVAARARGMYVAMGAPNALRGLSHSGNLSARAAIAAGVVDMLAADYAPSAMLHAAWALHRDGMPLPAAVALITSNPADALGLHDRGRIAPGMLADLVLVESAPRPRVRGVLRAGRVIYWDCEMHQRAPWLG
jgi:alpha-D-ribose 1-methylphosphonate 5-triphosphate diphosphatase